MRHASQPLQKTINITCLQVNQSINRVSRTLTSFLSQKQPSHTKDTPSVICRCMTRLSELGGAITRWAMFLKSSLDEFSPRVKIEVVSKNHHLERCVFFVFFPHFAQVTHLRIVIRPVGLNKKHGCFSGHPRDKNHRFGFLLGGSSQDVT